MRNKIFISHATPDDNEFARWLSLQLIGLGYEVWCDVLKLKGGEDFWAEIENEIRNNAIKFLFVKCYNFFGHSTKIIIINHHTISIFFIK